MSEHTLRGGRLGAQSVQGEHGVEFAARKRVSYVTDEGRRFTVTFVAHAEAPAEWVDQKTGQIGYREDEAGEAARQEAAEKEAQQRTHWDMLLERRTREELNELLEERLAWLRSRRSSQE